MKFCLKYKQYIIYNFSDEEYDFKYALFHEEDPPELGGNSLWESNDLQTLKKFVDNL